jgi:hypothetical protein
MDLTCGAFHAEVGTEHKHDAPAWLWIRSACLANLYIRLTATFNSMVVSIREQTEEVQRKNEENEHLLLNILPGPIA